MSIYSYYKPRDLQKYRYGSIPSLVSCRQTLMSRVWLRDSHPFLHSKKCYVPITIAIVISRVQVRVHCGGVSYKQGQAQQRTARQRRSWLGEWAATKLCLNITTAPGPGAGVTGKQQRRCSGWHGGYCAMCMQGQANCPVG